MSIKDIATHISRSESSTYVQARLLGLKSKHGSLMVEQIKLRESGQRRCYKCQQTLPFDEEHFYGSNRCCKKCEKERALARFYEVKDNPTLIEVLKIRIAAARSRAKKKNVSFDIDLEYLLSIWKTQEGKCFYSKLPMAIQIDSYHSNRESLSIDRIEPSKGYVKGNIALCCDCVNTMKSNMSIENFKYYINLLVPFASEENTT